MDECLKMADEKIKKRERVEGFGHFVYKKVRDPRVDMVTKDIQELSKGKYGNPLSIRIIEALEKKMQA